ncbi:hypothetical protein A2U01_0100673, partial [Trifolium medium]|nr:hypothetical protein [Trifolium medium]
MNCAGRNLPLCGAQLSFADGGVLLFAAPGMTWPAPGAG